MLRILHERAKAGVEIKVIGSVAGRAGFDAQKLAGRRLHTRTIIRDRRQAFVGSQSLRTAELDSRREVGLDHPGSAGGEEADRDLRIRLDLDDRQAGADAAEGHGHCRGRAGGRGEQAAVSAGEAQKAVQILTKELDPLAVSVKKAVRIAVAKVGDDVLGDKDVKETMKKVVKKAVKDAVKEAVHDAQVAKIETSVAPPLTTKPILSIYVVD